MFSVRLAARIVDTPANEMHTDAFIEVGELFLTFVFMRKLYGTRMICPGGLMMNRLKSIIIKA